MSYAIVASAALIVSCLTMFSGFGLGTLLMPVFALFFPVEVAVAATAVVHVTQNLFKLVLLGRHADRSLVVGFGLPALGAAVLGAVALGWVSTQKILSTYQIAGRTAIITPVKLVIAGLMMMFACGELVPRLREVRFDRTYLFVGGALSGFFGGFSGHQGAIRAAFLVRTGVPTEAFVGTNTVIGALVDLGRVSTYLYLYLSGRVASSISADQGPLVAVGVGAALLGVVLGTRVLNKVTMNSIRALTGTLLVLIALALGSGVL